MQSNSNRSKYNQLFRNRIVDTLANNLRRLGYAVNADDIDWESGVPSYMSGYKPDILAVDIPNNKKYIVLVEDDTTYSDDFTRSQLQAFSKDKESECYLVVPDRRSMDDTPYEVLNDVKAVLKKWNLENVKVGLYNKISDSFTFV